MNYRTPLKYHFVTKKGWVNDLNFIRDRYILEVFVNGGEEIYSVIKTLGNQRLPRVAF